MLLKFLIAFIIAVVLTTILSIIGINPILMYLIIISFVFVVVVYVPLIHPVYVSKNIKQIEKFLKNNRNPFFQLYYALGNKVDDDVTRLINQLLKKYKGNHYQALFKTIYFFYKNDYSKEVLVEIENIKPPKVKVYYLTIYDIQQGLFEKASDEISKQGKGWMNDALKAELLSKQGDLFEATKYAKKALENSRGLQRYLLYCEYKREFNI